MKYIPTSMWARKNFSLYKDKGFKVFRETSTQVLFTNTGASETAFEPGDDSFQFGFWVNKNEMRIRGQEEMEIKALKETIHKQNIRGIDRAKELGIAIIALKEMAHYETTSIDKVYLLRQIDGFNDRAKRALTDLGICTCDARFSGMDEAEYSARGCPKCSCFEEKS